MDADTAVSVEKLKAYYQELEERFETFLSTDIDWEQVVPWKGMDDPDLRGCLDWLTHFECTHQGILSVYLVGLGIDFAVAS